MTVREKCSITEKILLVMAIVVVAALLVSYASATRDRYGVKPLGRGQAEEAVEKAHINTATQADLELLPGIGPVTAEKIIAYRTEHGPFTAPEELLEVDGIGEKTLLTLREYLNWEEMP